MPTALLNVKQFAESLGVTCACIRRWVLERKLTTVKVGRLIRIPASETERLITDGLRPARATKRTSRKES